VIGQRTAAGWDVLSQTNVQAKAGQSYNIVLAVNGLTATVVVDNATSVSRTFAARVEGGYSYGLNWGLTGVGSDSSRGSFDNVAVKVLAPEATTTRTDEFTLGVGTMIAGQASTGSWTANAGRLAGAPTATQGTAVQLVTLGVQALSATSFLELSGKLQTAGQGGFVFDRYDDQTYKFVLVDAPNDKVQIGHRTSKGVVIDATVSRVINTGVDYAMTLTLKGSTVSVALDGQVLLGFSYNALTVDGRFGLLSTGGATSFDTLTVKTNDGRLATVASQLVADAAPAAGTLAAPLQSADIAPVLQEAIRRWGALEGRRRPRHWAASRSASPTCRASRSPTTSTARSWSTSMQPATAGSSTARLATTANTPMGPACWWHVPAPRPAGWTFSACWSTSSATPRAWSTPTPA
jgi:hypothetical protein